MIPFSKDLDAAHAHVSDVLAGRVEASPGARPEHGTPRTVVVRARKSGLDGGAKVLVITPAKGRFTRVLRLRFKSLNGSYHLMHDAREALNRYAEIDPDLVVVDERCDPKGEFVNRLKVKKERSLTSVIKIYGKNRNVRAELDFKIWENDFLVDPFDTLELFSLTEAELLRVPRDRRVFVQQVHFEFRTTQANINKANKLSEMILQHALNDSEESIALYAAVKEGIDNAVVHGNKGSGDKTVDVNFLVDHKKITVIVEDEGKGFDYEYYLARIHREEAFEEAKRRILEEGTRGGLGILLMSKCADRIDYSGAGNILRLEKNV